MNTKKSKVRLWSVLTALTAILTIAAIVGNMIANQYATTLNAVSYTHLTLPTILRV